MTVGNDAPFDVFVVCIAVITEFLDGIDLPAFFTMALVGGCDDEEAFPNMWAIQGQAYN